MFFSPIEYNEPLYRPPAEAASVIIQATIGCSWNKCAFCQMYKTKKFSIKPIEEIEKDIKTLSQVFPKYRKFFIADGNALCMPTPSLLKTLHQINKQFKNVQRISTYASPRDILEKSDAELQALSKNGLKLLYVGIETGDDALLSIVKKGETANSTVEALNKAQENGMELSVMIISGLGGQEYSKQHAKNSAKVVNQIHPKFLSVLTLGLPNEMGHYNKVFNGNFKLLNKTMVLEEMKQFIERLEIQNTIFRSDHISNILVLKGILNKDKEKFIEKINNTIDNSY